MSGTGAAARSGGRRRDCAGAGWHPLGASASAADVGRGAAATDHGIVQGRGPVVGHALDRAAGHRRPARRHRPPAGPDGAPVPVHRGLPVRRAGRGASRGRPVPRRGLLRALLVDARSYPRQGTSTRSGGRRLDPLQGKTPRALGETRPSGAWTPRSRQPEPRPGRVITCFDSEM